MNQSILIPVAVCCALTLLLLWVWRLMNWVWLRPKKLERLLRSQGFTGNPYRVLYGDLKEFSMMTKEANSKPISISDDIVPRVQPSLHHSCNKYGMLICFCWFSPFRRIASFVLIFSFVFSFRSKLHLIEEYTYRHKGILIVDECFTYNFTIHLMQKNKIFNNLWFLVHDQDEITMEVYYHCHEVDIKQWEIDYEDEKSFSC